MSNTGSMTGITARGDHMGWQDFYRRRDALDAAVARGTLQPSDAFPTERELLLALHHRWARRLAARVELATLDATADPVDAVGSAWRRTAQDDAALLALLDRHADDAALRPLVDAEHRALATAAGLTEPADSPTERTAIGAAFVALQRTAPDHPRRRGHLPRRLSA